MITIIYGDNIVASRNYFNEQKKKSASPITFLAEDLTFSNLLQRVESDSLFVTGDKQVFIEELLTKKKPLKEFNEIVSFLKRQAENLDIVFWESKEVSKKQLNTFQKAIIKAFNFPKTLFVFLDELKPQNSRRLIYLFHKTLEQSESELIFYMLIRQFRLLLAVSETNKYEIDELKHMAYWQKSKLQRQAKFFPKDLLKNIYKKIYQIDISEKTGNKNFSLTQSIDFLLLSI